MVKKSNAHELARIAKETGGLVFRGQLQLGGNPMVRWEYKNLQLRTVPTFGVWSRISEEDLLMLEKLQSDGWEVQQVVNIRGSFGFTAHVLFILKRELEQ